MSRDTFLEVRQIEEVTLSLCPKPFENYLMCLLQTAERHWTKLFIRIWSSGKILPRKLY